MEPSGVDDSGSSTVRGPRSGGAWLPLAVATLLLGCGPGGVSPSGALATPGAAVSTDPGSGPPGSVRPSSPPAVFHFVSAEPVIRREAFAERTAVLPSAVTFAGGAYHAWVVAFASVPGTQEIHHLTSPDALTWTEAADASLKTLSDGLGNPGALPTSVLADGDEWAMYLTGALVAEPEAWDIWRATAPSPDGPWTRSDAPVLLRGPAGTWDSGGLDFPTVLRSGDRYLLMYSGSQPAHAEGAIGLATSSDGIEWAKHDDATTTDALHAESDAVLEPGLCGGFDARAVHQPRVFADGDRLVMAYAGYGAALDSRANVSLAESSDGGLTWRCLWPTPALQAEGLPDGFVHTLAAFQRADRVALLVEWFTDRGTDVYLAEAPTTLP